MSLNCIADYRIQTIGKNNASVGFFQTYDSNCFDPFLIVNDILNNETLKDDLFSFIGNQTQKSQNNNNYNNNSNSNSNSNSHETQGNIKENDNEYTMSDDLIQIVLTYSAIDLDSLCIDEIMAEPFLEMETNECIKSENFESQNKALSFLCETMDTVTYRYIDTSCFVKQISLFFLILLCGLLF